MQHLYTLQSDHTRGLATTHHLTIDPHHSFYQPSKPPSLPGTTNLFSISMILFFIDSTKSGII